MKQIEPCPKCKEKYGWSEKRIIYGDQFFDSEGEPTHFNDNSSNGGRRRYCSECGKDITKLIGE